MSNLECTDNRILNICSEIFSLLKSGENEGIIHKKEVSIKTFSTGSKSISIVIGFLNFQMIWKPIKMTNLGISGSDEGASVFITLPIFQGSAENMIKTSAYYSERNNEKSLIVISSKNQVAGKKRINYIENIVTTDPL